MANVPGRKVLTTPGAVTAATCVLDDAHVAGEVTIDVVRFVSCAVTMNCQPVAGYDSNDGPKIDRDVIVELPVGLGVVGESPPPHATSAKQIRTKQIRLHIDVLRRLTRRPLVTHTYWRVIWKRQVGPAFWQVPSTRSNLASAVPLIEKSPSLQRQ